MRMHRFYIGSDLELSHNFWLHNLELLHQWNKVLRFKSGQEVVLFDGQGNDRLYRIVELKISEAHLELVTEFEPKFPKTEIYLGWSILKKDKNDWVLQKATELGASHFLPLLTERTEKTGFDAHRALKIVTEAAEQSGRSDIPTVREPLKLTTFFKEFFDKIQIFVCAQNSNKLNDPDKVQDAIGILVGPEGGWSESEKLLFKDYKISLLDLHDNTLRAETAVIAALAKFTLK